MSQKEHGVLGLENLGDSGLSSGLPNNHIAVMLSRSLSLSFCHFSNSLVTDMGWTASCSNASSCLMNPNHLVLNFSGSSQAGTDLSLIALVTNQCSQHSDCPSSVDYVSISAHQLHYHISWFSSGNSGQQAGLRNTTCVLFNLSRLHACPLCFIFSFVKRLSPSPRPQVWCRDWAEVWKAYWSLSVIAHA